MENQVVIRYSEAFKLQVIREIEEGKHRNCHAAQERYGIRGQGTVKRWVEQHGHSHLVKRIIRVETTGERDELKKMKARIRELEKALADAHLDLKLEEAYTMLACREAGIKDVDDFKKKHAGKP